MCGFVGILGDKLDEALLRAANDTIHHRGPDASGVYFDADAGIGLAHKRLSIIELSELGAQPMASACGRYVIAFNGEIYNHQDIRQQSASLATHPWRGNSDTETLLELIAAKGVKSALQELVGMFAFALWDKKNETVTLARDRMGEKPLFYGWQNGCFIFGSEPKALFSLGGERPSLNFDAVRLYFQFGYVPAPYTIWRDIKKLKPGKFITLPKVEPTFWPEEETFWDLNQVILQGIVDPFLGDENDAMQVLEGLLMQSVSLQSIADVKLGSFLSGGIDSSLITALMQKRSMTPIKTFSIGFNEPEFNEAHHAREVAAYLGTDHHELYVDAQHVQKLLPKLISIFDEPFADTSIFPTFLVAKLASKNVKVCLSGDAGDELFCGYDRYFNHWSYNLWARFRRNLLIRTSSKGLARIACHFLSGNLGAKFWRLETLTDCVTTNDYFCWLQGNSGPLVKSKLNGSSEYGQSDSFFQQLPNNESRLMAFDCSIFLADDILNKVDRSSMAVSLETRAPFLDHRLVEFSWRLPLSMKAQNGVGKFILRNLLYKHVPKALVNRPKQGFSMPVKHWLTGDLKEWAGDMLFSENLKSLNFLDHKILERRWREHQAGEYDWNESIWKTALFASWLEMHNS